MRRIIGRRDFIKPDHCCTCTSTYFLERVIVVSYGTGRYAAIREARRWSNRSPLNSSPQLLEILTGVSNEGKTLSSSPTGRTRTQDKNWHQIRGRVGIDFLSTTTPKPSMKKYSS